MRKLQARDIFAATRLVVAVDVKEELKKICMEANNTKELKEEIGFDFLYSILEKAIRPETEKALYDFLANIFEMDVSRVREMPPVEFVDKILEAADPEEWKNFFSRVSKLIPKK